MYLVKETKLYKSGIAPTKTTDKPTVRHQLVKSPGRTVDDLWEQKLVFQCHFTPVVDDTNIVLHKVYWYINDRTTPIYASKAVQKERLPETYLRGETGLNSIKLNIEVTVVFFQRFKKPSVVSVKMISLIKPKCLILRKVMGLKKEFILENGK